MIFSKITAIIWRSNQKTILFFQFSYLYQQSIYPPFRLIRINYMRKIIQLGLLGKGIGRSRVKVLHELLGNLYGLKIHYRLMDLADRPGPVSLLEELRRCKAEGFTGVNITHPYKREGFKEVSPLRRFPEGLISINTVLFRKNAFYGDNTDYSGFCKAYVHRFGTDRKPGKVLMIGAGGVGLAIAFGLKYLGVAELVIYDTVESSMADLVQLMRRHGIQCRATSKQQLIEEMRQAEGLVNATPVGMFQYPGNPFPPEGFVNQKWAFDAVYTPENTPFL
jgi:shikimate dehydrogenase